MVFGQTLRIWSTLGWYDSGDFCFHRHYHYWLSWVECVGMMMLPMNMFLFVSVRFTLSELILCLLSFFSALECWDCAGFCTLLLSLMVPLAYLCACVQDVRKGTWDKETQTLLVASLTWKLRYLQNRRGHTHQNWCACMWHQSLFA